MTAWAAVHLLAAASALVVIALALSRGDRSPLRRPLALLAASQFAWSAASVGSEVTRVETYALLGAAATPLFPPLALHFVLTFLGRTRQLRWLLGVAYAVFGAQVLLVIAALVHPYLELDRALALFARVMLVTSLPLVVVGIALTWRHSRETGSELELVRTRLVLLALIIVPLLLTTDLLADLGLPVPRLSTLGGFTFNVLMTRLTLGLGLFTGATRRRVWLGQALVLGLFFAVSYLAIFTAFAGQTGALVVGATTLSMAFAVLGWSSFTSSAAARAGLERFATIGRFSAQMAHDLRNPLAGAVGWTDFFLEEFRRKGDQESLENAQRLHAALQRIETTIDRYQRLSRMEPSLAEVDANQLVTSVAEQMRRGATAPGVTVETRLCEPAPRLEADRVLLASALENLVANAFHAMPGGGTVTLATRVDVSLDAPELVLAVQDTGVGFDARAREQAFELFFTTRARGSGLGLAFVRQVAEAHHGRATLESREGVGSTLSLRLPLSSPTKDLP
jgi:two-component system sensor histidine kinase HydH